VHSVAFSSDGSRLVTVDQERNTGEGLAILWNAASGARLQTFAHGAAEVLAAAESPDGSTVLTGSDDGLARLFDAETGQLLSVFQTESDDSSIAAVAFSPDGSKLLTAHLDGYAASWELPQEPVEAKVSITRAPNGALILTWPASAGSSTLALQECSDLGQRNWIDVESAEPGRHEIHDATVGSRFFRAREQ
jgi:hypothetical protein